MTTAVVVGTVSVAVLIVAAVQAIPSPEGFWPVTVVGWISAILGLISILGTMYAVHRFSQKPLVHGLEKVEATLNKTEAHFDQRILEERKYFLDELAEIRRDAEHDMNAMTRAVDERLNRFGGRVQNVEDQYISQATIISGVVTALAESRLDRANITKQLDAMRTQMDLDRTDKQHFERELFKQLAGIKNRS